MLARTLAVSAAALLALAGCTSEASTPAPVPTTTQSAAPSETILNPELAPQVVSAVTADYATTEGVRLADAIQALIDPAIVLDTGEQSQTVPADDDISSYFGILRVITVDPANDPIVLAQTLNAVLSQSGWSVSQTTNESGIYLSTLVAGPAEAPWVLFIEGNASVAGEASVSFTLGSPDITA